MALQPSPAEIQVVNVDMAVERQKQLREALAGGFKKLAKDHQANKALIFTLNQENQPLETVLRVNPHADALFTTFNYDLAATLSPDEDNRVITSSDDLAELPPKLRYPAIGELLELAEAGAFRHRRLVFVGDVQQKLEQFRLSKLPVQYKLFASAQRGEVGPLMELLPTDPLTDDESQGVSGAVPVTLIQSFSVAGVEFHGVVHMPEVANRFHLDLPSAMAVARLLFGLEGLREVSVRENLALEKLTWVRGKKVFMVLEPDLDHVVSERLHFDKMEKLYRFNSVAHALPALEDHQSGGLLESLESSGYELVFTSFSPEERDMVLMACLGSRKGEVLEREVQMGKAALAHLEDQEVHDLLYALPQPLLDEVLDGIKNKSYERFLAMVPAKIRENVTLDFLKDPGNVKKAWESMDAAAKTDLLNTQSAMLLANYYLQDSPGYKAKFPQVRFDFQANFDSSRAAGKSREELNQIYTLLWKSLEKAAIPQGLVARQFSPGEIITHLTVTVTRTPVEFYNRLSPLSRKNLWTAVGRLSRETIAKKLHFLDKLDIIKGNKASALPILLSSANFVALLKSGESPKLQSQVLLTLKKYNKAESKSGLLKKVLTAKDWKPQRTEGMGRLLALEENKPLVQRIHEQLEVGRYIFDSLICTRADFERLKNAPPLAGASVTFVDGLVDGSLMELFGKDKVSREEYARLSGQVEEKIGQLQAQMASMETEDPLGVYLLESMQMLNQMGNQALMGQLEENAVARLDARQTLRRRMIEKMEAHRQEIDRFLEKAEQNTRQAGEKIEMARQMAQPILERLEGAKGDLKHKLEGYRHKYKYWQDAQEGKRKVALTQKELSLELFDRVKGPMRASIRRLPLGLGILALPFGLFRRAPPVRRIIFKFTDAEIEKLLRRRIVLASPDQTLKNFIHSCMRIDQLQDNLILLTSKDKLPPKLDLLFYGPGYTPHDFQGKVAAKNLAAFTDEDFALRLADNEKLKAGVKVALSKGTGGLEESRQQVEAAKQVVLELQGQLAQVKAKEEELIQQKGQLLEQIAHQQERRLHYGQELELLAQNMDAVDGQFEAVKQSLKGVLGQGQETLATLKDGQSGLAEKLAQEMLKINKEMARLMYIKGVKDAGSRISQSTQDGIVETMSARERFGGGKSLQKILVADDGSNLGLNIKRIFAAVAQKYFKLKDKGVVEMTLNRLEHELEQGTAADAPFLVLVSGDAGQSLEQIKKLVKKIRTRMPDRYQMVFTPAGEVWNMAPDSDQLAALNAIKENACLVNTSILDPTNPQAMLKLLAEKAPLN